MSGKSEMRIAVTGLRGIPDVMGGVETHCEELLPRVAARAPGVTIAVLGRKPYLPAEPRQFKGVAVVPLAAPRKQSIEAIVSTLVGILHARRHRYDVVHIHAIGPGLLTPLARLLGLRVVMTHHGTDYDRAKWGKLAKRILWWGEQASLRWADRVIAVSPSLADMLRARYPLQAAKVRYIPNGAPTMAQTDASRAEVLASLGLNAGGFILAVGRLVEEKGLDYLIEAHRQSGITLPLAIVGASDHASPYASQLLAKGNDQVRFLGLQPRSVLRHLYETTALFVLPSFHEGLPIVALEAARSDAPMLLSDIAPNRDVGLSPSNYFPVGDVGALAAALSQPLDRYRIDADSVRRRFDWDAIADQTLAVYREIA
ncbi:glycosyltransferase family 4 protein [Sphingomonas sp. 37zxx]|uniref:glycosyltransferase family 4 protein n=1 Tax=Sphingomonas sp. 37zxx TaxID=1550073 RepID=UPI001E363291|nr:glycosyltransferase family 4 protein [Sphingomonas sp. 37zxx]